MLFLHSVLVVLLCRLTTCPLQAAGTVANIFVVANTRTVPEILAVIATAFLLLAKITVVMVVHVPIFAQTIVVFTTVIPAADMVRHPKPALVISNPSVEDERWLRHSLWISLNMNLNAICKCKTKRKLCL